MRLGTAQRIPNSTFERDERGVADHARNTAAIKEKSAGVSNGEGRRRVFQNDTLVALEQRALLLLLPYPLSEGERCVPSRNLAT